LPNKSKQDKKVGFDFMVKGKTKRLLAMLTAAALALSVTLIAPLTASAVNTTWEVTASMDVSENWDGLTGGPGFAAAIPGLTPAAGGKIEAGDTIIVTGNGVVLSYVERIDVPHTLTVENGATIQTLNDGDVLEIVTTGAASAKFAIVATPKITLSGEGTVTITGSIDLAGIDFEVTGSSTDVVLNVGTKTLEKLDVKGGKLTLKTDLTIEDLTVDSSATLVFDDIFPPAKIENTTNNGTVALMTNAEVNVINSFTNNGTLNIISGSIYGDTLTNAAKGTINISADKKLVVGAYPNESNFFDTLTNAGTINVAGNVYIGDNFTNEGTINVTAGTYGTIRFDASGKTFKNNGTILIGGYNDTGAGPRGEITVSAGTFENNNRITNNGLLRTQAAAGTITNFGTITNNGALTDNQGTLNNAGTITNSSTGTISFVNDGKLNIVVATGTGGAADKVGRLTNLGKIEVTNGTLTVEGILTNGSQSNKTAEIEVAANGTVIFDGGTLNNHAIVTIVAGGTFDIASLSTGHIVVYPGSKIVTVATLGGDETIITRDDLIEGGFIVTRGSYVTEEAPSENSGGGGGSARDQIISGGGIGGGSGGTNNTESGGEGGKEVKVIADSAEAKTAISNATRGTVTLSPALGVTSDVLEALSIASDNVKVWVPYGNHGVAIKGSNITDTEALKDLNFKGGAVEVPERIKSHFPEAKAVTGMGFVENGDFGGLESVTLSVKLNIDPKLWGSVIKVYSVNPDGSLVRLPASRIVSGNGMVSVTISNYNSLVFVVE